MYKRPLILIILLAAALRVGLLVAVWNNPAGVATPDTADYVTLSDNLMDGSFDRVQQPGGTRQPEIFRTPGYPLFLLLGTIVSQTDWWRLVLIVQIAIDVLLVYLTYLLACMVFDHRTGLWAAIFQATSAIAVASSMRLLSDGLFAMLLTLAVLLFVHHWKFARRWSLAASAAVLAAACYVRPVGEVFAAVLAAALLTRVAGRLRKGKEADVPSAVKQFAMFVGIMVLFLGPWIVRNAARADYAGFSSFASDSVYFYAVPELLTHLPPENGAKPMDAEAARRHMRDLDEADESRQDPRSPGQTVRFRQAFSTNTILAHPWLYARLHLKGVTGFFLPGATDVLEIAGLSRGQRGTSDVLRSQGPWAAAQHYFGDNSIPYWNLVSAVGLTFLIVAITAWQYLGVILFVLRKARRALPSEAWLLLVLVLVAGLLSGPYGFPRYQTMIVPILSVLAAAGYRNNIQERP